MKKIILTSVFGFALASSAFAQSATGTATTSVSTSTSSTSTTKVICIQNAIEKRDTSVIAMHDTFNTSIKNALTSRKDALKAAWAITNVKDRKVAQATAWKNFKSATQAAHDALRNSRKAAWSTFEADAKVCGVRDHGDKALIVGNPTYAY